MMNRFLCSVALMVGSAICCMAYEVTIITSVYKGDGYINSFLEDIARQTIYSDCQHIIINANSPDHEERALLAFAKEHPNVEYLRLSEDPGLYAVWNMAIKKAKSDFLINANLDDHFAPHTYELLLSVLKAHPDIDLVYSDAYITSKSNQLFGDHTFDSIYRAPEHTHKALVKACYIGSHPMWRKSMHNRFGLFNEKFSCAGDWEMWLRASSQGAKFLHVAETTGLNYLGPTTLTHSKRLNEKRKWEQKFLAKTYGTCQ